MSPMYIKNFRAISKKDIAIAGGKGASLAEMTKAGILVPPDFVVLPTAFDQFIPVYKRKRNRR